MPKLIADCPLCGGPVYDIEGQKDCPSCKAELPEWFADVEPEYAPRYEDAESVLIQWIAEKVWKIEHVNVPAKHWLVVLNDGGIFRGESLAVMLMELKKGCKKR